MEGHADDGGAGGPGRRFAGVGGVRNPVSRGRARFRFMVMSGGGADILGAFAVLGGGCGAGPAAGGAALVACGRPSVGVFWRPLLPVAIVTHFVTRPPASRS